MNDGQSGNDIDREGIGMVYACGAGAMVGKSVVYATQPIFGWLFGSVMFSFALYFDLKQRYSHTDTDRGENDE